MSYAATATSGTLGASMYNPQTAKSIPIQIRRKITVVVRGVTELLRRHMRVAYRLQHAGSPHLHCFLLSGNLSSQHRGQKSARDHQASPQHSRASSLSVSYPSRPPVPDCVKPRRQAYLCISALTCGAYSRLEGPAQVQACVPWIQCRPQRKGEIALVHELGARSEEVESDFHVVIRFYRRETKVKLADVDIYSSQPWSIVMAYLGHESVGCLSGVSEIGGDTEMALRIEQAQYLVTNTFAGARKCKGRLVKCLRRAHLAASEKQNKMTF